MAFNSVQFLVFLPVVLLVCFCLPRRIRYIWLLVSSYYFYMCWNARYALLLLLSTVTTYLCGLLLDAVRAKQTTEGGEPTSAARVWMRLILACSLLVNLGILFFFKYFDFAFENLSALCAHAGIVLNRPAIDVLLPVGISFYAFQALGYTIDVYRGETAAERNFLRYALFVSFFPQLVAGPIERSKNLLRQLSQPPVFQVENMRYGLLTIAYGLVLKLVIADRIAVIIDPVLAYDASRGMHLILCIVLFAFQIYCDFHGYTQIAIGSAKLLGYDLQENFRAPYLATNVRDFWRRWHISLTSWFTDYLYIPLGGSRCGRVRTCLNLLFVFLCSGLWHGASWSYVLWGGLNGLYLVLFSLLSPLASKANRFFKIDTASAGWRWTGRLFTFALVDYSWLFFRAKNLPTALALHTRIAQDFSLPFLFSDEFLGIFGSFTSLAVLLIAFYFLCYTDSLQARGVDWKQKILDQQWVYRWVTYFVILFAILIFGVYGTGYEQTQFIYFQF